MTTRTNMAVVCSCGHSGAILKSENDQPYSKPWVQYELENLNGSGGYNTKELVKMKDVFAQLSPSCPKCGAGLSTENLVKK